MMEGAFNYVRNWLERGSSKEDSVQPDTSGIAEHQHDEFGISLRNMAILANALDGDLDAQKEWKNLSALQRSSALERGELLGEYWLNEIRSKLQDLPIGVESCALSEVENSRFTQQLRSAADYVVEKLNDAGHPARHTEELNLRQPPAEARSTIKIEIFVTRP